MIVNFSPDSIEGRRNGITFFKYQRKKNHPWILYPRKISFWNGGEIKTFLGKGNLGEFVANRHTFKNN